MYHSVFANYDTFKGRWTDIKTVSESLLGERDGDWFGGSAVSLEISHSSGDRPSATVTLVVGASNSDGMLDANNVGQLTVTHDIFFSLQDIIHQCEFASEDLFILPRC